MPPSPLSPRFGAALTHRSLLAVCALMLAAFVVTAATLVQIAHRQNEQAEQQSLFFAEKALQARRHNLLLSIGDYAHWGDAYQNLHAELDLDWAYTRQNLGATLYEKLQYEGVFVVAANGQTRYAVIHGQLQQIEIEQWLQGPLDALLLQARENSPDEQSVAAFLQVDGQPALVAAAGLTTGGDPQIRTLPGAPSVLLFVDILTPEKLLVLGHDYALHQLRTPQDGVDAAGVPRLNLDSGLDVGLSGTAPQRLRWDAAQPGQALLTVVLPLLALAGLVFALLIWLVLRNGMTSARLMAASYRHLHSSEAALAASEARFRDVAEASSDWLWETDAELRLSYLSERFQVVTGHAPDDWLGRRLDQLLDSQAPSLADWMTRQPAQTPLRCTLRCSYSGPDAELRSCRIAMCQIEGADGLLGYRGTASDITEEVRAQARIEHMSLHDGLTDLPNRNRLHTFLADKLLSVPTAAQPLVMLSLDLDRFKLINDTRGHAAGDDVLNEVAQRLRQCLRGDDLVARQGGDEFILVLTSIAVQADVERLCARLLDTLARPFHVERQEVFIGASIGVAIAPRDAVQASELLRYADMAMYQAKHDGGNTWRFYAAEMNERIHTRHLLENDLRQALAGAELRLHYQPRYRIDGLQLAGAEALVRWQHPQRGWLGPDVFIPLAEETALIVPLGAWVLRQACAEAASWTQPIRLSVNLSPVQFRRDDLVALVQDVLTESGLPPARLELEITENVLLEDAQGALRTLNQLKALGVRLSMDDFGTGYSSLSYLRTYPFDTLKIDRSFIADLDGGAPSHAIVHAIIGLGNALSMTVTAEGVETAEQLALLAAEGCDEAQGFYLSRPIPAEQLRTLLHSEARQDTLAAVTDCPKQALPLIL